MSETPSSSRVAAAMVAAQAEIRNPCFDSSNPHFNSQFVSLAGVLEAVRPVLNRHKVAVLQPTSTSESRLEVRTVFMHESGEQVSFPPLAMPITDRMTAQQLGSTVSYLRRYSLMAALGIAGTGEDDDGNDDAKLRGGADARPAAPSKPRAQQVPEAQSSGNAGKVAPATRTPAAASEPATARRPDHVVSKPAQVKPEPSMGSEVVGTVIYVKSEPGERSGKPYTKTRIGIKPAGGGETQWLTSFSMPVAETAASVNKSGKVMRLVLGGKSGDLVTDLYEDKPAYVPLQEVFNAEEIPF